MERRDFADAEGALADAREHGQAGTCTMASTADAEAKAILLRLANDFVRLADRAEARLKQEIRSTTQGNAPNSVAG